MTDKVVPNAVPLLEARGLAKRFGHVHALRDVSIEAYAGEVLALVGDNGAGKSTLIKILSGAYAPDAGEILVRGEPATIANARDAAAFGIATVYQDLALVNSRDSAANIYLGREPMRWGVFLDFPTMYERAGEVLDDMRITIPSLRTLVGNLSGGQRQAVAIARAIARGSELFLMDEPTAALGVEQRAKVNDLILQLKSRSCGVVVITHDLELVFDIADRIAVMRLGRTVATREKTATTREEIVGLITGAVLGDVSSSAQL